MGLAPCARLWLQCGSDWEFWWRAIPCFSIGLVDWNFMLLLSSDSWRCCNSLIFFGHSFLVYRYYKVGSACQSKAKVRGLSFMALLFLRLSALLDGCLWTSFLARSFYPKGHSCLNILSISPPKLFHLPICAGSLLHACEGIIFSSSNWCFDHFRNHCWIDCMPKWLDICSYYLKVHMENILLLSSPLPPTTDGLAGYIHYILREL